MNSSRTRNSAKNAVFNLIAKLITMFCAFITRTIFLRYLGDQYTGLSTLFTDILNILSFTELGIGTAVSFSLYKPIAENDERRIAQLMKLYRYVYTIISVTILLLGVSLVPFLGMFVKEVPNIKESITTIYIMYVIKTSLSYLLVYRATLVIANQKQYIVTGIESGCTLVKTILDVIVITASRNYMAYLWLEILRVVVTNLLITFYSKMQFQKTKDNVRIEKSDISSLLKDVKDVFIYKVNGIVLNSTDSIIISAFVNIASVTLLSNYNMIFAALSNIIFQVTSSMTASVGNYAIHKTQKEQQNLFLTINFISFIICLIECTGLWLCSGAFVELLWGESYVVSNDIVAVLCINAFFVNMHLSVDMFRSANGIFHAGRMRPLATAIVNLIVSLVAVQKIGILGVLIGTVVSRLTTQVWYDPMLIYNIVFKSSAKRYFFKYFVYFLITVGNCALGFFIMSLLPEVPMIKFVVGFIYAVLSGFLIIVTLFRKSSEYRSTLDYFYSIIGINRRQIKK